MPVKQKEQRRTAGDEQGRGPVLAEDGHEGVEAPLIAVDRVVGPEGVLIADGHQSLSSENGGPGAAGGAAGGGKGEVENVPGYAPRMAEAGRFAEAAFAPGVLPDPVETG